MARRSESNTNSSAKQNGGVASWGGEDIRVFAWEGKQIEERIQTIVA